jgi:hypothetical protein
MPAYLELDDLEDLVIHFHDLSRMIEREIGVGQLSQDIRNCANRLSDLLKSELHTEK